MSALFDVNFDDARTQGERTIEALLAKFRQDVGNARFIGRFSVAGLLAKLRSDIESRRSSVAPPPPKSNPIHHVAGSPPEFAILSAAELIDLLESCPVERAREILSYEEAHLRRSTVLEVARRRTRE